METKGYPSVSALTVTYSRISDEFGVIAESHGSKLEEISVVFDEFSELVHEITVVTLES